MAGNHNGAFTAFCFEITDLLNPEGKNTLTVTTNNSLNPNISPLSGDFTIYGGLYRPVSLIETDDLCIKPDYYASPGVFISQNKVTNSEASISVTTLLSTKNKTTGPVKFAITVLDPRGFTAAYSENTVTPNKWELAKDVQELFLVHPLLWQGRDNPYLHKVKVVVSDENGQIDEIEQPLGLRSVDIHPQKGFLLNGYYAKLRGVSRHQDRAGKGWAITKEDEQQDINLMKDMGVTALRTAHYPQSRHLYDLCDKEGLIVWSEVTAIDRLNDTPEFMDNLKRQATEMVLQNGNHPSICLWGFFNEINTGSKETGKMDMPDKLREVRDLIKNLSPERPTVAATNHLRDDKLNNLPDHLAANVYPGWYGGKPGDMKNYLDELIKRYPDKGIAISEYGHGASIRMHENPVEQPQPSSRWHPEEWQALGHEDNYAAIRTNPHVWGSFIWNMFDFGADTRTEGDQPGINDKGMVTYDRKTPKDAYFFYKANWNPKLTAHITSRRFSRRTRQEVPVKVYSNAEMASLTLNGKTIGSQKPDELCRVIWQDVKLSPGENILTIQATRGKETVQDQCQWTYVPSHTTGTEKYDETGTGEESADKK